MNGRANATYTMISPGRVLISPMFFRMKNSGTIARKIGKVSPASIR